MKTNPSGFGSPSAPPPVPEPAPPGTPLGCRPSESLSKFCSLFFLGCADGLKSVRGGVEQVGQKVRKIEEDTEQEEKDDHYEAKDNEEEHDDEKREEEEEEEEEDDVKLMMNGDCNDQEEVGEDSVRVMFQLLIFH